MVRAAAVTSPRLRIIVCDDDPAVRELLVEMLTSFGHTTLSASGGPECLKLFNEMSSVIDLVIIDQTMPRMNGDEVIRALRATHPTLPIIWLSGTGVAERPVVDAVTQCATKPLSLSDLRRSVERLTQPGTP